MKPGARVQSAIDILASFEAKPRPIERMLKDWGRHNRYAGSKDRRAIRDYVYGVMRERGALSHKMGNATPRALMIAWLHAHIEDDWKTWLDGSTHAPEPLALAEIKQLVADELPLPSHAKLNIPAWLEEDVTETFGADATVAMAAMDGRAPVDLRANTLKADRLEVHDALEKENILSGGTPFAPDGLRLGETVDGRPVDLEKTAAYKSGLFEVQDEGSQIAAMIAGAKPGEQVVDLCAGAGGKTLALAATMEGKGQIFACDIDDAKLKNLKRRLSRAGVRNAQVKKITSFTAKEGDVDPGLADLEASADLVLLDAPCSGSGTWRRHPDARWRLTEDDLTSYCDTQVEVLRRGARLVKPGGRLVYVTCSILARENEEQVSRFLGAHADFSIEEIDPSLPGKRIKGSLQLTPHLTGTDGFFVAVLRKQA